MTSDIVLNKVAQIAEQGASTDIQALGSVIDYFDTHDLSYELGTMPEVQFEVVSPLVAKQGTVMPFIPKTRFTPQQYLEMERQADYRSEYVNGEILAMAGASREHILVVTNFVRILGNHLRRSTCETYSNDMRVRVSPARYAYPDVAVACAPEFEDASFDVLINPGVIIEVLSSSTENDDRSWKFAHYRRMTSLTDYVMVSQQEPLVEHYSRFQKALWTLTEKTGLGDTLDLPSVGCAITLADIYERVTFPERSRLPGEQER